MGSGINIMTGETSVNGVVVESGGDRGSARKTGVIDDGFGRVVVDAVGGEGVCGVVVVVGVVWV